MDEKLKPTPVRALSFNGIVFRGSRDRQEREKATAVDKQSRLGGEVVFGHARQWTCCSLTYHA